MKELEWELEMSKSNLILAEYTIKRLEKEKWSDNPGSFRNGETWKEQAVRLLKELDNAQGAFKNQKELSEAKNSSIEALWQDKSALNKEKQALENEIKKLKGLKRYDITTSEGNYHYVEADNYHEDSTYTIFTIKDEEVFNIKTNIISTIDIRG